MNAMKKFIIPVIALLICFSATQCFAADKAIPMFTLDHDWTWENLTYGPLEILASPVILLIGPVAGSAAGIEYYDKKDDSTFSRAMQSTGYGFLGGFVGLMAGPAVLLKGVADTLTGGAFTTGAFF